MNKNYQRIGFLVCPLAAAAFLSSCVVPGYPADAHYSSSGGGVYTTLPATFVGSAYYHDGRYYSGGSYQTGRYHYAGRPYTSRYYYNGQYIYGGRYQQHENSPRRTGRRDSDRRPDSHDSARRSGIPTSYTPQTYVR